MLSANASLVLAPILRAVPQHQTEGILLAGVREHGRSRTWLTESGKVSRTTGRHGGWEAIPLRAGLGRRILHWFLVLSLIPLVLTNSVGYLISKSIIEDQTSRYLNALTEGEARHVAAEIARHEASLSAFARGNRVLTASLEEAVSSATPASQRTQALARLSERLNRQLGELRPLSELMVIDTAGVVVAATNRTRVGEEWSRPKSSRLGEDSHSFAVRDDDREREPHLGLAVPIQSDSGTDLGILVGTVAFDELQEFLRIPPHLAGDVHTYLVDDTGRPLVVSHRHDEVDYDRPLMGVQERVVSRYADYEGKEVLGTAVPVPGTDWRYVSEVSIASAFGLLRRVGLFAVTFEAAFVLLLLAVVWLVAGSIIAPLHRLVGAAERIHAGDLGVEVEIDRDDEIGDLGRTFNQMSRELRESSQRITELHDQEMRRAAQLASVGELASGIAHEIKNPLVGILSGIDLLAQEARTGDASKADDFAREIRVQLRRMERAINDLLSYARPKPPRLVLANASALVERMIPLVRPQADTGGVDIVTKTDGDHAQIRVDPELMTQALVNLALNGIQAMEPGGRLEIATARINSEVHIAISDSGRGIPEDRLTEIFRPFFTSKHQGTGLGLAITRGIVERHGGRLEVESTVDVGSTFRITLPIATEQEVA